jgi:hypothetical protein
MPETFIVNGKSYNSLDEMPPDVRAQFDSMNPLTDRDNNGTPNIVEPTASTAPANSQTIVTTRQYGGLPRGPQAQTGSNLGPIIVLSIVCIGLALIVAILLFLVLNKT